MCATGWISLECVRTVGSQRSIARFSGESERPVDSQVSVFDEVVTRKVCVSRWLPNECVRPVDS